MFHSIFQKIRSSLKVTELLYLIFLTVYLIRDFDWTIYVSLFIPVHIYIYIYIYMCVCVCVCVCVSVRACVCVWLNQNLRLNLLFIYICICMYPRRLICHQTKKLKTIHTERSKEGDKCLLVIMVYGGGNWHGDTRSSLGLGCLYFV